MNLCANQLILLLAEPIQILSLSNLSHDPAGSYFHELASAYPVNDAAAEQILPLRPDVVIAGQHSGRYTLELLRQIGLQVVALPIADSMDAMIENVASVAAWLDQVADGE